MMNVVEIESTKRIRTLLSNYKFGGGIIVIISIF